MRRFAERLEAIIEFGGIKKDIALLAISGAALALSIFGEAPFPFDPAWFAIILCGFPILAEAFIGIADSFDIKADVLVSLALIASVYIGEDFAAGEIAFIMRFGALLEELTVARARAGIEKLVKLTPQSARLITEEGEEIIPAEKVIIGDLIRVLPGESVPVDGLITKGQSSINQAVMTGESLPVDKAPGDEVSSGTVNQFGAFEMKAVKVGEDSSIQRMIRLVQSADAGKSKIVGLADRWATWIVVIALSSAALTWLIKGEAIRAVTILVVFCPCAFVLATPTAVMAAIGNATKHGFLVREGGALERLAKVRKVAFDKTGTLTFGSPEVVRVVSCCDMSEEELLSLAASAEALSEHPLGKAVVRRFKEKNSTAPSAPEDFSMLPGLGVRASAGGREILAGNRALMKADGVSLPEKMEKEAESYISKGCAAIYVAANGKAAGFLALSDTLRPQSAAMVRKISDSDVQPVLLTGDNEKAAGAIAGGLKIGEYRANCLPEDKLKAIAEYQNAGKEVCMVGDGINDAPALKAAAVGIAMGGIGSDIAVDAADIALVDDKVEELPHLLLLSKRMMGTIKLNLTFSMTLNLAAIALAFYGVLSPVTGALVHNAGSVAVIVNSALLLKWQAK